MSGTSTLGSVALLACPEAARLVGTRTSLSTLPLDQALVGLAACVLLLCAVWAWLGLSATVVEAWRGVPARHRPCWHLPHGVRRVVLAACGVAVASSAVTVGVSSAALADATGHRHLHGAALLSGLPLPDRAVAPTSRANQPRTRKVVVRAGDSLWSIASRDLPDDAPDPAIAARWHAIYAANRVVIGPDPDLLEPGQRLLLPRKDPS
jgi:hypothetical protein